MVIRNNSLPTKIVFGLGLLFPMAGATRFALEAQAPAPVAVPTASQRGTVKAIAGNTITMAADAGQAITVNVVNGAKIVELAVGSTDLKTATASQLTDITVGDRVLVTGQVGNEPATFNAVRVILMKSANIAQKQAAEQADWKARGTGGIVNTVDPATGAITLTVGTRKLVVNTSSKTDFRRFASDSVKYEDARPGALAQVQPRDQLQARGTLSADGASMQAEEVISGSFENLSGLIASIDPAGKITMKDLATKKVMTVDVTPKSDIRTMPLQMATMFAARSSGGGQGGGRRGGGGAAQAGAADASGAGGMRRAAGADLSQMITRLPASALADLHKGDAVMIVASQSTPGASTVTALTVLSGVDPILSANPNGGMDLSMSVGGGGGGGTE